MFRNTCAMGIGDRIRKRREALGVERKELAQRAGIAYSTLSDLELGHSQSTTKLHRIASVLQTNTRWLESGRGDEDAVEGAAEESGTYGAWEDVLGYHQAISLGSGSEMQEYAETHKLKFRSDSLKRKGLFPANLAVYYGDGDSMEPRVKDGDALLFDRSDIAPIDDGIYIIRWGSEFYAKRAEIIDGVVYFRSDNPQGDHNWRKPKRMDSPRDPIEVIGRVRWIGSWEG